jgi:hypothetical protein
MSKILIVPDVHGRKFWHKAEEMIDEVDQVVFLGDYLDPYPHEGITFDDAIEEFLKILSFKEKYGDKVILLVGNHDMHYIKTEFMDCTRLNYQKRQDIHELYQKHLNKFSLVFQYEDTWVFSHAGVYLDWLKSNQLSIDDLLDFKTFLKEQWETLEDFSFYRGGWNSTGSCVWADIRESVKSTVLPGYHHIVGHTQLESKPYISDQIICLDVRRCFILDTETNEIKDA